MAGNARFIASHPLQYSALLAKTIVLHALGYANQFLSAFGPWRSHHAPIGVMLLYAVLIIGVALVRPAIKPFRAAERVILAAALGIAVIGIHVFLFIGEANPKLPDGLLNVGVQGRYFLPCAPAALLLLGQRRLNFSPDTLLKIIVRWRLSAPWPRWEPFTRFFTPKSARSGTQCYARISVGCVRPPHPAQISSQNHSDDQPDGEFQGDVMQGPSA